MRHSVCVICSPTWGVASRGLRLPNSTSPSGRSTLPNRSSLAGRGFSVWASTSGTSRCDDRIGRDSQALGAADDDRARRARGQSRARTRRRSFAWRTSRSPARPTWNSPGFAADCCADNGHCMNVVECRSAARSASCGCPTDYYTDDDVAHRVIYVEASRGCPFTCEFCLSSLEVPVRNAPLEPFLAAIDTAASTRRAAVQVRRSHVQPEHPNRPGDSAVLPRPPCGRACSSTSR